MLEKDEERDSDRHKDMKKDKFTFTECIIALLLALTFVTLCADFLVHEIEFIVHENHVSDSFMGLVSEIFRAQILKTKCHVQDTCTFGGKGGRTSDCD